MGVWNRNLVDLTGAGQFQDFAALTKDQIRDNLAKIAEGIKKPKDREAFENAVASLPPTMALVPVVYTKITPDQNRETMDEFMETAEADFYRHLAANHEAGLRETGFCDYALEQMRKGHAPTDSQGRLYNFDVDHVIERAGGGPISLTRRMDAENRHACEELRETFEINHMSNFFFLPRAVHEIKNTINRYQIQDIEEGKSKVVYMAVPACHIREPFYRPDDTYGAEAGVILVDQASYVALSEVTHAAGLLSQFQQTPEGQELNRTLSEMHDGCIPHEKIESIFNGNSRARSRYHEVCEAFSYAAGRCLAAAHDPSLATAERDIVKRARDNFKKIAQQLGAFEGFALEDGHAASETVAFVRSEMQPPASSGVPRTEVLKR